MDLPKPWFGHCRKCGFYASTLPAGPGQAFGGIEDLRRHNYETILDVLASLRGSLPGARILEIGCAKGWFLEAARDRQAVVAGVEPVAADAEIAQKNGLPVEEGLFPEKPSSRGPYDIIVFNDVFEHLPDPNMSIRAVADLLAPGGLAVINIPSSAGILYNTARFLDRVGVTGPFDRMWQRGLPSPHLSYFSPNNLNALVSKETGMLRVFSGSLPSIGRRGLLQRIRGQSVGLPWWLLVGPLWVLSFVMPLLPADIHLAVFRK